MRGWLQIPSASKVWMILVLAALFFLACYHLSSVPVRIAYPGDSDSVEGTPFAEIALLADGVNIYDSSGNRFHGAMYGPAYYLLGARLLNPASPSRVPLRLLSFSALLLATLMITLLAQQKGGDPLSSWIAAAVFLSYGFVIQVGSSARCDMMAFALTLAGFYVARQGAANAMILFSVPLFVAALSFKQQYIAAPVAVYLWLLFQRRWLHGAFFLTGMAGLGLASGAALWAALGSPPAFWSHLLAQNAALFQTAIFLERLPLAFVILVAPLMLAATAARQRRDWMLGAYLLVAVAVTFVLLGKIGSGSWYYLEPLAVASVGIGQCVARSIRTGTDHAAIFVLLVVNFFFGGLLWHRAPSGLDAEKAVALQNELAKIGGTMLSVAPAPALLAGAEVPVTDAFQLYALRRMGLLPDDLPEGYDALVLDSDLQGDSGNLLLTPRSMDFIRQHYSVAFRISTPRPLRSGLGEWLYIWQPNDRRPRDIPK